MITPVASFLRQATRSPTGPFNILKFYKDPLYDSLLCKTGHNFYFVTNDAMTWDRSKNPVVPENAFPIHTHVEGNKVALGIPPSLPIDFVLSDSRRHQFYRDLDSLATQYHIPILAVEHEPLMDRSGDVETAIRTQMTADINVFASFDIQKTWHMFDKTNSRIMPDLSKPAEFVEYWKNIFAEAHKIVYKGK